MPNLRVVATSACVLWIVSGALEASVFRCTVEGRALYTDRPCHAGDAPHALPWLGRVPAGAQADLAAEHDARLERMREARERDDAAWREAYAKRQAHDRQMERAIGEKRDHEAGKRWTYRDGSKKRRAVRSKGGKGGQGRKRASRP